MSARLFSALPLLAVTLMLATGGAPFFWPLGLSLVALASVVVPWRASFAAFGALLWMIAGATPPILWVRNTTTEPGLGLSAALLFASVAAVRLFLDRPLFGRNVDRALVGFACIGQGIGLKSAAYPYLTVLFAVSLLLDLAGGLPALRALPRAPRATAGVVLISALLATLTAFALPALDRATNRQFQALFAGKMRRVGFTPHVRLDDSGFISEDDDIVLRLRGAEADYLRGAVFDSFDGATWSASARSPRTPSGGGQTGARTEVEAPDGSHWLFAPRGARIVSDTRFEEDALGALRPAERRGVSQWAFAPAPAAPDAPTPDDLQVPPRLVPKLEALAREWTAGAVDDRARARALLEHLHRDFTYTLDREPAPPGQSALLDFLFVHREGHCEFFASAFVVLARVSGIPARLVAGFRVVEHNGFGGYAVVRAKHAHAWAEVFVPSARGGPGRFEVFDPTPSGVASLTETRGHGLAALFDYLRVSTGELYDAALASPERTIPVLGVILLVGFVVRALRNRRRKAGAGEDTRDVPPAVFVEFEARLAADGFVRDRAETLESFATRLARADREPFARALRRYVRARYGPGTASERELGAALELDE